MRQIRSCLEVQKFKLYQYSQHFNSSYIPDFEYDNSLFTVFMIVRNNTYAIKIDNITKLASIQQHFVDNKSIDKFKNKLEKVYQNVNYDPELANQNELAKSFLKFITETYDFGLSLYKTSNSDITSGTSSWEKITLDPTQTSGLKQTPCN